MKIKIGDEILVTGGKDKGRKGKVEKVFPSRSASKSNKVFVPGVNIYKKTKKGYGDEKGGIFEISRPLPIAKVALICPQCKKQTRVGYRTDKDGTKTRICLKCDKSIDKTK